MATAENLPAYRMPHIPHRRRIIAAAVLAVALAATAKVSSDNSPGIPPEPGTGRIPPEQMRYPWGTQLLELRLDPSGVLVEKITTKPQVLRATSFNVEEGQGLTFIEDIATTDLLSSGGTVYAAPIIMSPQSLENAYFVPVLGAGDDFIQGGDSPRGDPYLRLSDAQGNPVEGPNGVPIYTRPDQVNLTIPEQIPGPVTV